MTMREKTMQVRKLGALALLGAGLMLPTAAPAVEVITEATIINGLQGPTATIVVDTAALMAEVQTNMGKGIAAMPSWQQLAKLTQLVVDIEFEYNSTAIVPSSYVNLGAIADALHHPLLAKYKFLVVGHTDSTGKADYNLKLSLERANAITQALATTFAVSPKRLFAVGVGEELPADPKHPDAAVNRRVQLINIGEVR